MKKLLFLFSILILTIIFNPQKSFSQTGFNTVVEYATGTWCGFCPCGHDILHTVTTNYPNTMLLAYHGSGSDPWKEYSLGMINLMAYTGYPQGVIGRKTGVLGRNGWNNEVVLQSLLIQPGVSIEVSSKSYDAATRTLTASVKVTPLTDLTGDFYINYVLTENNLIYPQNFYAECGTPGYVNNYVHNNVVKKMLNGDLGELIHSGAWTTGQEVVRNINYVLPVSPQVLNAANCDINIFVYKQGSSISINSNIQQSLRTSVTGTTGIINQNTIASSYSLSQNYPNPFNPSTNFSFSIPKNENVSLKFYDVLGNEVATYVDGFLNAGSYSVEFDGSNLASGIYFYKLTTGGFTETKRMNLIK